MSTRSDELARQAKALSREEKERLVRALIEDLDASSDGTEEEVARLWVEEARRRFDEYLRGEVQAIPAEEVMAEARGPAWAVNSWTMSSGPSIISDECRKRAPG